VLLMAVDDVSVERRPYRLPRKRVRRLAANVMGWADRDDLERPLDAACRRPGKRDESRRHTLGHVTSKLEDVPFCATDDALGAEERRHQVRDRHGRVPAAC
jgi:hypothetical protein